MRISSVIFYLQLLAGGIFFSGSLYCQNLIFNGDFEEVNYCKEFRQPCSPSAWFYINDNPLGYHKRTEVNGYRNYSLLLGGFGASTHEYWETILADKLIPGKEYKLSFDLITSNNDLDCYGFLFTDTFFFSACDTLLASQKYITMTGGTVRSLKSGWIHIEKRFIADKGFQYLIIGKFGYACTNNISSWLAFDNMVLQTVKHYSILNNSLKDSLYAITQRHSYQRPCNEKAESQLSAPLEKKSGIDSLILDDIQFAFNSYAILNPEVFEKFKTRLDPKIIKRVVIYGYTDSVGSERFNLNLSQMRADAIKKLLIMKYSIPDAVIEAIGKGISREYADIRKNRRVEILVFSKTE